jgi:hypothetical protein
MCLRFLDMDEFLLEACSKAPRTAFSKPKVVARMLASEVGITGIEEDTLCAARIIHHAGRQFTAI